MNFKNSTLQLLLSIILALFTLTVWAKESETTTKSQPLVAVCNDDGLVCASFINHDINYGLLPFALHGAGFREPVSYQSYSKVFINNTKFDIAVLTSKEAEQLAKGEGYQAKSLPINNDLILLTPKNFTGEQRLYVGDACILMESEYCSQLPDSIEAFKQSKAQIVVFESRIKHIMPSLLNLSDSEVISTEGYKLVFRDGLKAIDPDMLAAHLIGDKGLSISSILMIITSIVMLLGLCGFLYVHHRSFVDLQSGCYSKRAFELDMKKRGKQEKTIMLIDYNNFKKVNDTAGHPVGDKVIELVSSEILSVLRVEDKMYRIGGDEFLIVFNNKLPSDRVVTLKSSMKSKAKSVAEKLNIIHLGFGLAIGCHHVEKGQSLSGAYKAVDEEMYLSKKQEKAIQFN